MLGLVNFRIRGGMVGVELVLGLEVPRIDLKMDLVGDRLSWVGFGADFDTHKFCLN